jgi:tetratricopeptide (TPR) repeat protein
MSDRPQEQHLARLARAAPPAAAKPQADLQHAVALHQGGRLAEAEQMYRNILAAAPDHFDAIHLLGVILLQRGRHIEGEQLIARALQINPNDPDAHNNRGTALKNLRRFEEALSSYADALALRPNFAEAFSNRGVALYELKRYDEALASHDRALALRPDHVEALSNRGDTLHKLERYDDALASYARALALRPDYVEALSNRGNTFAKLQRFDEALASFERAIALKPDYAEAHFNRSLVLLLTGNYADGWDEYEWRLKGGMKDLRPRQFACPQWQGQDVTGKTIFLHPDQGYGDLIQFCRYVPLLAERGARVVLEVHKPLHVLMTSLPGAAQIVSSGDPLPDFDVHCPLLSLPRVVGTRLQSIPSTIPYLRAPAHALQHWKARLGPRDRPRIGICWAGNPNFRDDRDRSIGLSPMLPLLANPDVQFFSLQRDLRTGDAAFLRSNPHITVLGQDIETFSDTAAIISAMDLVISSDTSVVHLAGALGKPIWILLQLVPDWRWLLEADHNPWYPTARLFRQDETRKWEGVIARVHAAIQHFCGASA